MSRCGGAIALVLVVGCGGESGGASSGPPPGVDAGLHCAPGESALPDGGCRPAGIPPEACGAGFVPDEAGGCTAILPAAPCREGQMAIPGEDVCREVAPCARGTWGDIPVEATNQYVDASYAGGASEGTETDPWTSIQAAIDAAAPGAIVAIAAGSYVEDLALGSASVRLWGRCPSLVEVVGTGAELGAIYVRPGADASEIRDLAVRGPRVGIVISGATDVLVSRAWVHDAKTRGIDAEDTLGPTSIELRGVLVERVGVHGVFMLGVNATIEESVVRDTQPGVGGVFGPGIASQDAPMTGQRGTLSLRASVIERNREVGVLVAGSDATVREIVVRDTAPRESDGLGGDGLSAALDPETGERGVVTLSTSVLERNHRTAVFAEGSDMTIDATAVRDTQASLDLQMAIGRGITVQDLAGQRATMTLRDSVVERSIEVGIAVTGSDATIERTRVRDVQPSPTTGWFGRGISADGHAGLRPTLALRSSVVERTFDAGVLAVGTDATLEDVLVSDVAARAADGSFGDGFAVVGEVAQQEASGTALRSRFQNSARAGVSAFSATMTLGDSTIECAAIYLDGEVVDVLPYEFVDQGGNHCGCGAENASCKVVTSDLAPPDPPASAP